MHKKQSFSSENYNYFTCSIYYYLYVVLFTIFNL